MPALFGKLLTGLLACLLVSFSQPALERIPGVTLRYFEIAGDTPEALQQSLRERGPIGIDGSRYEAYTSWALRWDWPVENGTARIDKARVAIEIDVQLPEWKRGPNMDAEDAEMWARYIEAVKRHEAGHVLQALYHRDKLESLLRQSALRNPALTPKEAHRIARGVMREARAADVFYDEVTQRGALQGARLPVT